jgi:hypothetical protein
MEGPLRRAIPDNVHDPLAAAAILAEIVAAFQAAIKSESSGDQ